MAEESNMTTMGECPYQDRELNRAMADLPKGDPFWQQAAHLIITNIPPGSFRSTDCQPIIRQQWPDHPLETRTETPILPKSSFSSDDCRCNSGPLNRITDTIMPHKTIIRLSGVARNPANGFPARLLAQLGSTESGQHMARRIWPIMEELGIVKNGHSYHMTTRARENIPSNPEPPAPAGC